MTTDIDHPEELLAKAEERIREHRTALARLRFVDREGQPLSKVRLRVRLVRHAFKLGANAFRLFAIPQPSLQAAYEKRFADLLNYATLPFYWGSYERREGYVEAKRLEAMADWCKARQITTKGHPLVWHQVFPSWAESLAEAEVLKRLEKRVREIVRHFQGRVDIWDVVNEATVSHRADNAIGHWVTRESAARCVAQALEWAYEANPEAMLLYNDFNISRDLERLVQALLDAGAPLTAIGIQSHMHKELWPLKKAWQVCETYARFGLPLHFTELTILSGRLKARNDNDWHQVHMDWPTTPEGEEQQLAYGQQLYTLLFSYPAVEAITWWDLSDNGAWQGAPAGLVREDMTPKPLYDWLMEAFHRRWTTDEEVVTDATGAALVRCFHGHYGVHGRTASGVELRGGFSLEKGSNSHLTVQMG